jgi:hypothetical protein
VMYFSSSGWGGKKVGRRKKKSFGFFPHTRGGIDFFPPLLPFPLFHTPQKTGARATTKLYCSLVVAHGCKVASRATCHKRVL